MKVCSYCDRTFHKTEHLLRHERSHTGEKPFHCLKCGRRYARSDVLLRHVKFFHSQDASSQGEQSTSDNTTRPDGDGLQDCIQVESAGNSTREAASQADPEPVTEPAAARNMAPPDVSELMRTEQSVATELDTLAAASILHAGRGRPDEVEATAVPDEMSPQPASARGLMPSLATPPPDLLSYATGLFNGGVDVIPSPSMFMIDNVYTNDPPPGNGIFGLPYNNFSMLDFMDLPLPGDSPQTARSSQLSSTDRASSIPLERFAQVSRLWPGNKSRMANRTAFASKIWADVASYKGDNICTNVFVSESSPTPVISKENESKWGMDEDKRQELIREFASNSGPDDNGLAFPPTRLLNLGLDIAFRQPHSLLPFIHRPTFSAKLAPNSIVFSLCLLGLVLLDSKQVREFTLCYLPAATEKCCGQLATPPFGPGSSIKLINQLTSATLLLMAWSICSPRAAHDEFLSQMLYSQTFSLAQVSGLFTSLSEASSLESLLDHVKSQAQNQSQSQSQSDDVFWKAWARIESVKRLISTLTMTDAWWAYNLGAEPLIRTPIPRFEMPCSIELFQASSSRSWKRLVDNGACIVTEPVTIHAQIPSIPLPESQDVSPVGIAGLLSIIWNRILHARAQGQGMAVPPLVNEQGVCLSYEGIWASGESGKMLLHPLNDIYVRYSKFLRYKNPNCIAMWHFLNLGLFADLGVFELAAGRNGAEPAYAALQNITAWSRTWHARRACLHAAGIYAAMSRRRINDGTMFHSEVSLFVAALVLGLHVFMMQPDDENGDEMQFSTATDVEPYELLNEVDWMSLGGHGVTTLSPTVTFDDGQDNPARRFLRDGGVVSFSGTICEGGYNAAKMILLEFASLLEEVGKWNAKGFCHILRIMSDSLLDMEDRAGGG